VGFEELSITSVKYFIAPLKLLAPNALSEWSNLGLQPFSDKQDVVYVTVYPKGLDSLVCSLFDELTHVYQELNLGKYSPLIRSNVISGSRNYKIKSKNLCFYPINTSVDLKNSLNAYKLEMPKICKIIRENFVSDVSLGTGGLYETCNEIDGKRYFETMPVDPYTIDSFKYKNPPVIMFYFIEPGYNGQEYSTLQNIKLTQDWTKEIELQLRVVHEHQHSINIKTNINHSTLKNLL